MAEALAFVALAGNVLQFLEAATGFVANAVRICRSQSAGDASSNLNELRRVAAGLQRLLVKLQPQDTSDVEEPGIGLTALSRNCAVTIQQLLAKLDKIGLGNQGLVDHLLAEFKATWNSQAIQDLETRIVRFREQLAFHLVVTIRDLATQSLAQQDVILSELKRIRSCVGETQPCTVSTRQHVPTPGSLFIHALSGYLDGPEDDNEQQLSHLRAAMHDSITSSFKGGSWENPGRLKLPDDMRSKMQQEFISKFDYREREHRKSNIEAPHAETFAWIFPRGPLHKKTTFSQWLQSGDSLFWITGKAGSGKSTLMKYVSEPQSGSEGETRCHPYLKQWVGKSRLLTASFYFWASGTAMERSQDALFKSVLHQIFDQVPTIIPRVSPAHWESLCLLGPPLTVEWSRNALQQLFLRTVEEVIAMGDKICFFVDGLDEFEGDLSSLIATVHQVSKLSNVKICVSSRPWEEFEQAFGEKPSLRVQDLTRHDIQRYVRDHFDKSDGFKRLQLRVRDGEYAEPLLAEIVDKSAGVFLWVKLVVATLLAGLSNDDRISDLKKRLDHLPPELERVYARILDDLDPFYWEHACQYFKLTMACGGAANALLMSFADEDWDFAIEFPVRPLGSEEKRSRIETLRRRHNSRCKGLLEISVGDIVNFLHRTARDYIASAETAKNIEETLEKSKFDPYLQLCAAQLMMLKTDGTLERRPRVDTFGNVRLFHDSLEECLVAASKFTQQKAPSIAILDSLRKLLDASGYSPLFCELLPSNTRRHLSLVQEAKHYLGNSFLALATRFSVVNYLEARVPAGASCELLAMQPNSRFALRRFQAHAIVTRMKRFIPNGLKLERQDAGGSESGAGQWPLLLAACFTDGPNVQVFRILLERGGKCGVPWDFCNSRCRFEDDPRECVLTFGKEESILPVILSIAVASMFQRRSWGSDWEQVFRMVKRHGAATYDPGLRSKLTQNLSMPRMDSHKRRGLDDIITSVLCQLEQL